MNSYEKKILNGLLDKYERSLLSRGENRRTVRIDYPITKKTLPAYFDLSSDESENIHACLHEMEYKGFVSVQWKNGREDHIAEKVFLNTDRAGEVYRYLGRTPKREYERRQEELLRRLAGECRTSAAAAFISWLQGRIRGGEPVREFIDLPDLEGTERLVRCVCAAEQNEKPLYYREFSILHFRDSKIFEEKIKGKAAKVFRRFGEGFEEAEEKEIFAEYGIYDKPNYIYLKGEGTLFLPQGGGPSGKKNIAQTAGIPLQALRQGIGISGEDLENICVCGTENTRRVITIENLTTFFRWQEPESLIIYLGGYHNRTRRRLLKMVYEQLPGAEYLHFGDIDAGGFEIYEDLRRKTGILFRTYHMGSEDLERYLEYAKPLTADDRRRLEKMLKKGEAGAACQDVLRCMLEHDRKLEQECIGALMESEKKGSSSQLQNPANMVE